MGTKFIRLLLLGLIILSLRTSLANTHTLKIGINAFEKQLHTAYIQHSRFAIINKDFQEIFDEKIENEEIDFLTDTEMVYQKVQKFLNLKIEALKKLTITAEDTSAEVLQKLSHIKYKTFYARLQDNIGQYVIDAKICKEHRLRLNDSLVTGSTFENILSEDDPRSKSKAGVHVAVESYHCLEGLIKDFNWTAHPNLRHTFVENEKNDDQISRQYIGTYSGLTKLYPAKAWVVEPKIYTYDLYDPRYRPWFYAAESAPKDILLLLDFSGSAKGQTQHLTKMTVLHVLSTLNPNDYINAIWFNSRKDLVMKNCFEGFVPATTRNKRLLRNLLENIEDKDQAFIGPALEMSYDQFIKLTNMSDTYSSGGHKLIMLFSDGIEEWPVSVIKNYTNDHPDEIVRIFGFSMGYGVGEQPPLNWMACKTDAEYTIIDSVADVKLNSRFYLDKLSEVLSHSYRANPQIKNRPISFTTPYMDAQKHGAVLSLSMPILNKADKDSNGFIGVAGIDFKLSSLADLIKLPNSNFYAFIIDNNGIVYYHPKLKIPKNDYYAIRRTACRNIKNKYRHGMRVVFGKTNEEVLKLMGLTDSIPTTDILEIEYYSKKFEEFRTNMIDQHCGEVIEDDTREYRCLVLEGTPLIIGFVYRKEEPTFKFAKAPQNFVVHPSFNDITYYDTDMKTFCNRSLADNDSINKIVEMASYTDNRCKDEQTVFFHYLNAIANWVNSWYGKQGNINNCSSIHIPRDFNQKHYYLSFIQTRKNFNVVFPVCQADRFKEYNSQLKFDFRKHRIYPKLQFIIHSNGIVTSRSIVAKKSQIKLANVGVDWSQSYFNELFNNKTQQDRSNWQECFSSSTSCYLTTRDNFVIASTKLGTTPQHLMEYDAELFRELNKTGFIKQVTYTNYHAECQAAKMMNRLSSSSSTSVHLIKNILNYSAKFIKYSFWWNIFNTQNYFDLTEAQPQVIDEDKCSYSKRKIVEFCATKQSFHELSVKAEQKMGFYIIAGCKINLRIIPFNESDLFLFIKEKKETKTSACKSTSFDKGSMVRDHQPVILNDCTLSTPKYRRKREDLDYTRFHEEEEDRICPSAGKSKSTKANYILTCAATYISIILIRFYL